jgi:hypothetical protein
MRQERFKEGDTVRFVRTGIIGWEQDDWAEKSGCVLGHTYTIRYVSYRKVWGTVLIEGHIKHTYYLHPDHFEKVAPEPKLLENGIEYS